MKIGILGGTFDPVHQGHLLLARAAQKQFQLEKVLFIPALIPPHKTHKRDIAPAAYRYRMVEIAIKNEPGFELSDIEFNRPEVSYTVDTLRALKHKYPESTFFLIVGADAANEISGWKEPEAIFSLATLAAAGRPGTSTTENTGKIVNLNMPEIDISSSEIRSRLSEGHDLPKAWLPQEVEAYIRKMKLYQKVRRESVG